MRETSRPRALLCAFLAAAMMLGCDKQQPTSPLNPLTGMFKTTTTDSSGVTTGDQPTPGYFHGTVRAQSEPGAHDTMTTALRLANVRVTVYEHVQNGSDTLGVGPVVASVTTDATGAFQTPVLPGALYIVAFAPPQGSVYHGVWVAAVAHAHSADYEWFIVLPK